MTPDEYRDALNRLSDEQFEQLKDGILTSRRPTREDYVLYFVQHPEQELCYVLNEKHGFNLKTEEEKNTWAAQVRAVSARCALGISLFALGIAALSLAFSVGLLSID